MRKELNQIQRIGLRKICYVNRKMQRWIGQGTVHIYNNLSKANPWELNEFRATMIISIHLLLNLVSIESLTFATPVSASFLWSHKTDDDSTTRKRHKQSSRTNLHSTQQAPLVSEIFFPISSTPKLYIFLILFCRLITRSRTDQSIWSKKLLLSAMHHFVFSAFGNAYKDW